MNHPSAQIFRGSLFLRMAERDFMPRPVFLDNHCVIDGDFRSAVVEIARWITAGRHHRPEKLICLHECAGGIVHELGLDRAPRLLESVTIRRGKRPDVVALNALFNLLKLLLSFEPVPFFCYSPVIFRSKAGAKLFGAILQDTNCGYSYYSDHDNYKHCNLRWSHPGSLAHPELPNFAGAGIGHGL